MRIFMVMLALSILGTGCASRSLMHSGKSIPTPVEVVMESDKFSRKMYSIDGRETAGILPTFIEVIVSRKEYQAQGSAISAIRTEPSFERTLVTSALQKTLARHQLIEGSGGSRLTFNIQVAGLQEVERGYFSPFIRIHARLEDRNGKKVWSATAHSYGTKPRKIQEFQTHPDLYVQDFSEVANDITHQLIKGPLRQLTL